MEVRKVRRRRGSGQGWERDRFSKNRDAKKEREGVASSKRGET